MGDFVENADEFISKAEREAKNFDQCFRVGKSNSFKVHACAVCDRIIKGTAKPCFIPKEEIKSKADRIGCANYESFYGDGSLPELLKKQYEVKGYEGLLLSKNARCDDKGVYACESCKTSLKRDHRSPPKHAIANGFAIGHLPKKIKYERPSGETITVDVPEALTSDVLCAILSPRRPFLFCISYHGGAHKSLRGHVQFFE